MHKCKVFVSFVYLMSLYLLLGCKWKSDLILGHIYAEIEQILKGSQTFKQHCKSSGGLPLADSVLEVGYFGYFITD